MDSKINMDKIISELPGIFKLKDTTEVGDIVVIVMESPQSILYGLVTSFERDRNKKGEWWNVGLQILVLPPQKVVWTLRTPQFTGQEVFTMGGEKRFIQAVDFMGKAPGPDASPEPPSDPPGGRQRPALRVIK